MICESFSCHNLSSVDRKSKILGFSESLERYLSNGTIKVDIREIKVFSNLAVPWSEAGKWKIRPRQNFGLKHII